MSGSRSGKFSAAVRERRVRREVETRRRLLESALALFAERGFKNVTVREISREAHANVAAVSYHFGDKLGLYSELIDSAIARMRTTAEASIEAAGKLSPEDKLRHYVRSFLPHIARLEGHAAFIRKLIRHELAEPTPAARRVIQHGIEPRLRYLSAIVSELLDGAPEEERVRLSVLSIQALCLFYARDPERSALFEAWMPHTDAEIARAAEHVAEFCLAGVRAQRRDKKRARPSSGN